MQVHKRKRRDFPVPTPRVGRRGSDSICIMPGCGARAGLDRYFCMPHWEQVPYDLQLGAMVCRPEWDEWHAQRIRLYLLCRAKGLVP